MFYTIFKISPTYKLLVMCEQVWSSRIVQDLWLLNHQCYEFDPSYI